jgi:hypothetical protein
MNRLALLLLVILSAAFLGLLAPSIIQPSLYTLQNDSVTLYHANPAALEQLSQERSAELSTLMQDLLDAPRPVVLNIRIRDFEEAERAFEEYRETSRSFDSLAVSLELTESAVGDFQRENRKNLAALERMINESARFAEINQLEIRYRSEDNEALLYTITYEGEAVQQALAQIGEEFREREPDILEISGQLGLNTTLYREAVELLEEVVDESRREQEVRAGSQPALSQSSLMLGVTPKSGRYGDTLQVTGSYTFLNLPQVILVLDSRDWKTLTPDASGVFRIPFPIGKIRAGDHVIFASSGQIYSNIVAFTVLPTETSLTLDTGSGGEWDEVLCTGSLSAGEIPVRNAPVRVVIDGFEDQLTMTSDEGTYSVIVVLTGGGHTLQAIFDDPGFPLLPSSSAIRNVSVFPRANLIVTILIGGGILALTSVAAGWYLTKSRRRVITAPGTTAGSPVTAPGAEPAPESSAFPSPPDVLIRYRELFEEKRWREAAHLLFSSLIDRLVYRNTRQFPKAMTAREFAGLFSETPLAAPFRSFVARYEEVRYGGRVLNIRDPLLTCWNAILSRFDEGQHE